ncbi:riboflavin synthase [Brachybacterium alimentarium]|uniref:Riboflavin synthase n=1 Tax=Brachybacterium alimentarium TaxID=47845 RepID=A0A2A3YGH5_9MICO|nr:riboflavin synthase [Brachybacterium alimentarium]PCC31054.1 riboflavin synthase [Brachybacterium alimentarium]PCC38456.1 riboflavin synthase [Brachybacterium alimentarium]RCS67834.1 riboflavin synthase [Brachybacterium alimentarium]RCS77311.1 riboflavin synthase [Brachybacterium alimentarium]RCS78019.1 riboflavin synthase [Brachybacterium alimentarium]
MFTGIIEELGTVESLTSPADPARLTIRSPQVLAGIALGDSIAVNGCCLTVTAEDGETWSADVIATTLEATTLGGLAAGDPVNLERCVRVDGRLDGHIVQGHVDATGEILDREEEAGTTRLRIQLPAGLARYVVAKGSLAVDGVSLTVAAIDGDEVTIGLIPETLARTTLGRRDIGHRVNLEVDVLAKHVEKLLFAEGARR